MDISASLPACLKRTALLSLPVMKHSIMLPLAVTIVLMSSRNGFEFMLKILDTGMVVFACSPFLVNTASEWLKVKSLQMMISPFMVTRVSYFADVCWSLPITADRSTKLSSALCANAAMAEKTRNDDKIIFFMDIVYCNFNSMYIGHRSKINKKHRCLYCCDIYLLLYGGFTIINCYLYVLEKTQDFSFVVMKNVFLIVLSLLFPAGVFAEPLQYKFASRDTCDLYLDVYLPDSADNKGVCILYAFGGGFREGSRRDAHTVAFMQRLADAGMVAVAMDYRLGFKGNMEEVSPVEMVRRFSNAVDMAVEDMFSALRFVYDSCGKWGADSSKIVLSGGSAGAITALQCDYALSNGEAVAGIMPEGYRPAGVISCSGAVCVFDGKLKYRRQPAPTMFLHGTKDKLVSYDKFVLFGKGMYGSKRLVKIFEKNSWPYWIMRFENFGHEIAAIPQIENVPDMVRFIDLFVSGKVDKQIDETIREAGIDEPLLNMSVMSFKNPDNKFDAEKYIERVSQ